MAAQYIITGYERIDGGHWRVTVSVRPGERIHITVPASSWSSVPLPAVVDHVVGTLLHPRGVPPATQIGAS